MKIVKKKKLKFKILFAKPCKQKPNVYIQSLTEKL